MTTWEDVQNVRVVFDRNVGYVEKFLIGKGLDMGCGSCPLNREDCIHLDISPQPLALQQLELWKHETAFIQCNAAEYQQDEKVRYIFSSHMLEDLGSKEDILNTLVQWSKMLEVGGFVVLLLPDMQGGRYPTVEEGGNLSHRVNVGAPFFEDLRMDLLNKGLDIVQMDTIPHESDCTIDVVLRKTG
jgi:hypothetical protein